MDFSNQAVVVTGAAGYLGGAVARAFGERQANLVLVARRFETLAERFGADNDRQLSVAADLTRQADATAVATQAIARFHRIDVLCNIAGGFRMGPPVHETSDETWNLLFDLNVRSMLNMVRATVPRMLEQGGGRIVNIGAYAAQKGAAPNGHACWLPDHDVLP